MSVNTKICTYIGLGHMGMPVYRATQAHFRANNWRMIAVDINSERLSIPKKDGAEIQNKPPDKTTIAFIGVRPQDFGELTLYQFQADIIVSMMAGISINAIQTKFPNSNIFRIIPNTPCEFGLGITPIYTKNANLSDLAVSTLYAALSRCGVVLPVPQEKMIDWATGISAGGPAYIMYIAKAMIDAGCEMGFEPSEARSLVAHTLAGSSKLLLNTNKSPEILAREVMTPKGTTEQGVHLLEANNVNSIVKSALLAAAKRANELSKIKGEGE